jgi:hypothetical protein
MAKNDKPEVEVQEEEQPRPDNGEQSPDEELQMIREGLEPQTTYDPEGAAKVQYANKHPEARNYFGPAERVSDDMASDVGPTKI